MFKRFFIFIAVTWIALFAAIGIGGAEDWGAVFLYGGVGLALWAGLFWVIYGGLK